jgi:hypothetical protein
MSLIWDEPHHEHLLPPTIHVKVVSQEPKVVFRQGRHNGPQCLLELDEGKDAGGTVSSRQGEKGARQSGVSTTHSMPTGMNDTRVSMAVSCMARATAEHRGEYRELRGFAHSTREE